MFTVRRVIDCHSNIAAPGNSVGSGAKLTVYPITLYITVWSVE